MRYFEDRERALQPFWRLRAHRIPATEATHHGTGAGQRSLRILGHDAVVDRHHSKARPGPAQQREPAAEAEADHSRLAGAVGPSDQELAGRVERFECRPSPRSQLLKRIANTANPGLAIEQVRR